MYYFCMEVFDFGWKPLFIAGNTDEMLTCIPIKETMAFL